MGFQKGTERLLNKDQQGEEQVMSTKKHPNRFLELIVVFFPLFIGFHPSICRSLSTTGELWEGYVPEWSLMNSHYQLAIHIALDSYPSAQR